MEYSLYWDVIKYDKQDQQGKVAFNELSKTTIQRRHNTVLIMNHA
jgi:hypothetical protein